MATLYFVLYACAVLLSTVCAVVIMLAVWTYERLRKEPINVIFGHVCLFETFFLWTCTYTMYLSQVDVESVPHLQIVSLPVALCEKFILVFFLMDWTVKALKNQIPYEPFRKYYMYGVLVVYGLWIGLTLWTGLSFLDEDASHHHSVFLHLERIFGFALAGLVSLYVLVVMDVMYKLIGQRNTLDLSLIVGNVAVLGWLPMLLAGRTEDLFFTIVTFFGLAARPFFVLVYVLLYEPDYKTCLLGVLKCMKEENLQYAPVVQSGIGEEVPSCSRNEVMAGTSFKQDDIEKQGSKDSEGASCLQVANEDPKMPSAPSVELYAPD